jgi:hypothetical protein
MLSFAFSPEQEEFRVQLRKFQKRIIATAMMGKVAAL